MFHLHVLSHKSIAKEHRTGTYTTHSRFFSDEIADPKYCVIIPTSVAGDVGFASVTPLRWRPHLFIIFNELEV
jgi:hypothetical protein